MFSACGTWRYLLWRGLTRRTRVLGMGMLNPSTADHLSDDPTIARCRTRAAQSGFAGLLVWNLFAFRATLPRDLTAAVDPVGPHNDAAIALALGLSRRTILAWGHHGSHGGRDREVLAHCRSVPVQVLGLTCGGHPRHPLYLASAIRPRRWTVPA